MDLPIIVRAELLVLPEHGAEVVGILEAGQPGDLLHLQLRMLEEQLLALHDADGVDVLEDA